MLRLCCEMMPSMSWPKIKYSLDLSSIRTLRTRVASQLISKSLLIMLVVVAFLILFILLDGFHVLQHITAKGKEIGDYQMEIKKHVDLVGHGNYHKKQAKTWTGFGSFPRAYYFLSMESCIGTCSSTV